MSENHPDRRLRQPRLLWRRPLLLVLGVLALLGGLGWTASAATGWLTDDTPRLVAADQVDPTVATVTDALEKWLGVSGQLTDEEQAASQNLVFGSKEFLASQVPQLRQLFTWLDDKLATRSREEGTTIESLEKKLDDLDGDGDAASDFHGIEGLVVDFDADITPKTGTGPFDVTVRLKAKLADDAPLAMNLDGLKINGRDVADALDVNLSSRLHVDPKGAQKVTIKLADSPSVGTLKVGVDGTYSGDKNPLAFQAGVLGVRATGSVKASAGIDLALHDPNGDGVLDQTELASPASLVEPSCVSDGAKVDLTVTTDLAGLTAKAGRITLDDTSLCNGLAAPDLQLGDLGQFRNLTLGDVVNGLAQVTRSLSAAQAAGDLDLPFVQEPLRDLVKANEKLVAFFVDNGFTDPANPMASITVDTADTAAVKTVQDLAPRLATALGMSPDALSFRYDNGRALLNVKTGRSSAPQSATLDLGDTLSGVGITADPDGHADGQPHRDADTAADDRADPRTGAPADHGLVGRRGGGPEGDPGPHLPRHLVGPDDVAGHGPVEHGERHGQGAERLRRQGPGGPLRPRPDDRHLHGDGQGRSHEGAEREAQGGSVPGPGRRGRAGRDGHDQERRLSAGYAGRHNPLPRGMRRPAYRLTLAP